MFKLFNTESLKPNQQPWVRYIEAELLDIGETIEGWRNRLYSVQSKVQNTLQSFSIWLESGLTEPQFSVETFELTVPSGPSITGNGNEQTFLSFGLNTKPDWATRADVFVFVSKELTGTGRYNIWIELNDQKILSSGNSLRPFTASVDLSSAEDIDIVVRGMSQISGSYGLESFSMYGGVVYYPNVSGVG